MKRPALSRPMDVSSVSNRFVLIATPVIGTVVGVVALVAGESLWDSAWWGYFAAGSGFLAWATARELHPDRVWVATVATLIAPWGVLIVSPDLLVVAGVLLVARALAGTTGRALRTSDVILLAVVAVVAAFRPSGPGVVAVGAVGLALVALRNRRGRRSAWLSAAVFGLAAGAGAVYADTEPLVDSGWWVLIAGAAVGAATLVGPGPVSAGTDRQGGAVDVSSVRLARGFAVVMASAAALTAHPAAVFPVFAAFGAVALRPR